jgi:hypothetical protein
MIDSTDPDYLDTKLVKQGVKKLDPIFQELAEWINQKFDTKVLNIYYDKIKVDKNRPRLSIIFEYFPESRRFCDQRGNFDSVKQAMVTEKLIQILSADKNFNGNLFTRLFKKATAQNFNTKRLLVIFTAFEPVAREEVNKKIPKTEIDNLEQELLNKNVWKIYREFSMTILFFYTDNQIQQYTTDGTTELLKKKYLDLLKKYDEFDYFKPETSFMTFDSKENFDKTYQGNWFYYYKR